MGQKLMGWFSTAREVSHSLVAVFGIVAAFEGLIVTVLAIFNIRVTSLEVDQRVAAVGVLVALLSKGFDSANDAIRSRSSSAFTDLVREWNLLPGAVQGALGTGGHPDAVVFPSGAAAVAPAARAPVVTAAMEPHTAAPFDALAAVA